MSPRPKVSIILLNWNGYEVSRACIESVQRATYSPHDIVFVDNASKDGSGERIRSAYPAIKFLQNDRNLGFSRGCNVGIKAALERGADYVLLLNNDTTVEPGFLEPLIACAEADPRIGLVSGKMLLADRRDILWYAGGRTSRFIGGIHVRGHKVKDEGQFDLAEETGACTGAMMLISKGVLETVGMLPEEYFFGQEEWDYSLTVRRAGFRLFYCPQSVVYHKADGSHRNTAPKFIYCGHRNRLIFQTKFLPKALFPFWLFTYANYVRHLARFRLKLSREDLRAFQIAWEAALRDHRRSPRLFVDEDDLLAFEREFDATIGSPTSSSLPAS